MKYFLAGAILGWQFGKEILKVCFLVAGILFFLSSAAPAAPAGTHQTQHLEIPHDLSNPSHWYPYDCCSQHDCEPIPHNAVSATKNGWRVIYTSKKPHIGVVREHVDFDYEKVRPSPDGQFHGCWLPREAGTNRAYGPGGKNERVICFYYPEPGA